MGDEQQRLIKDAKPEASRSADGDGLFCDSPRPAPRSSADDAPASGEGAAGGQVAAAMVAENTERLERNIIRALQQIFDPEIPVNIYDLGLIYGIDIYPLGRVAVRMTLTSPACPVAGQLPPEVEDKVRSVDGVSDASVEIVWDPPWTMDMMSEEAKLELNLL